MCILMAKRIMTPSRPGKGRAVGLGLLLQGLAVRSTGQRGPAQASPSALAPQPHPLQQLLFLTPATSYPPALCP